MTLLFFCLKMVLCEDVVPRAAVPSLQMKVKVVKWNGEWNLIPDDIY